MPNASYLVRFDDLCPTAPVAPQEAIEEVCRAHGIKPIVAVIPDNQDPRMRFADPDPGFWERMRRWQRWGWTIGLHGYQHQLDIPERGEWWHRPGSEFAGASALEQRQKLEAALAILAEEGIRPTAWVAPNHTFDRTTVQALVDLGLPVISDGMARNPHRGRHGEMWVPCQLWSFAPRRSGVWTVCLHPNWWDDADMVAFAATAARYAPQIIGLEEAVARYGHRDRSAVDAVYTSYRTLRWRTG